MYRVGELAALTGVTVRTLHHYDRIGLLCPGERSEGGHRLYSERAALQLQQILTLRYLGFPLGQIRDLLARPEYDLAASLRAQQRALNNRAASLARVQAALGNLLDHRLATGRWDWSLAAQASVAIQSELNQGDKVMDKTRSYFTPEQLEQFDELGRQVGPDEIKRIEGSWTALLAEVRAASELDPASQEARAVADRWETLNGEMAEHYRAYPELWTAIGQNYEQDRYADVPHAPTAEDFAFIQRVKEARQGTS